MPRTFRIVLLLPVLFIAACANFAPKAPPPQADGSLPVYFSDRLPSDPEKIVIYSVPNSYFGVSPHQRGSAAVGIAFGPLGVAANIAYMQEAAKKAAVGGEALFAENLPRLVNGDATRYAVVTASERQGRRYEVMPSVAIQFESDTQYSITCNTWVYLFDANAEIWKARYAVSPGRVYSAEMLGTDAALRADIRACVLETIALFDLHRTSGPEAYGKAEMDIGHGTFTMPIVKALAPDRVVYNDPAGLWDLDKRNLRSFKLE